MTEPIPNSPPARLHIEQTIGEKPFELPGMQPQGATESFDDPAVYQAFVNSLFSNIKPKLAHSIQPEIAAEIAGLTRLLSIMPRKVVQQNRVFFELAYNLLQAAEPNMLLLRSIRRDLAAVNDRYVGGLSRILLFVSGKTLLNAVLSALATIFLMSFFFVLLMSGGVKLMFRAAGTLAADVHLSDMAKGAAFNQLLLTQHGAFLGSIVSIMVRIKSFLSDTALTPLMAYVSVVTRPLVSVLVAVLAFCTIQAGIVSFHGLDIVGPNGYYVAWALGFLCGFSERLAQNFVLGASSALPESTPNPAQGPKR